MSSDQLISQVADAQRQGSWATLDALLSQLAVGFDGRMVPALLETLFDDLEHEAEIFGIVHLAETVEDEEYVAGMLRALPLMTAAPRWRRTIMIRVLNSEPTLATLLEVLPRATEDQRSAVMDAIEDIEALRPGQFTTKAAQVRSVATSRRD